MLCHGSISWKSYMYHTVYFTFHCLSTLHSIALTIRPDPLLLQRAVIQLVMAQFALPNNACNAAVSSFIASCYVVISFSIQGMHFSEHVKSPSLILALVPLSNHVQVLLKEKQTGLLISFTCGTHGPIPIKVACRQIRPNFCSV